MMQGFFWGFIYLPENISKFFKTLFCYFSFKCLSSVLCKTILVSIKFFGRNVECLCL